MKKSEYPWWICERRNPQLGVYYIGYGQMSKTAAKEHEKPGYGRNTMHQYPNEEAYKARLADLKKAGESVQ